jgi:hypothetical protein
VTALVTALFSLGFVIYLEVGDVEARFGGGTIAVVVLLGVWLFVANVLLLGGYETVLELEDVLAAGPAAGTADATPAGGRAGTDDETHDETAGDAP